MRIISINTTGGIGSTGTIAQSLMDCARAEGHSVAHYCSLKAAYCLDAKPLHGRLLNKLYALEGRLFCADGCTSILPTLKMIRQIEKQGVDLFHLHNLHGHYINVHMLFDYIKEKNVPVIWTLHDCWSFTGHCPHYSLVRCEKWKTECKACSQYRAYPYGFFDRSNNMYHRKKEWFSNVKNMTIVTPSKWLADQVGQSFLSQYPVRVINNGINLDMFKPTKSTFRDTYSCVGKKIVLGVAFDWGPRKGLDVFIHLAESLGEEYQIVLVGTNDDLDKRLPRNIVSIHKTNNQHELAEIYSAADIFVNPTREDNFPTVNIEALACGTPVITFKTGGSPEIIDDTCGLVVPCDDVEALKQAIRKVSAKKPFTSEACIERAKKFDERERYKEYISLYRECVQKHAAR